MKINKKYLLLLVLFIFTIAGASLFYFLKPLEQPDEALLNNLDTFIDKYRN